MAGIIGYLLDEATDGDITIMNAFGLPKIIIHYIYPRKPAPRAPLASKKQLFDGGQWVH